jgi:hypothetical protein
MSRYTFRFINISLYKNILSDSEIIAKKNGNSNGRNIIKEKSQMYWYVVIAAKQLKRQSSNLLTVKIGIGLHQ